MFHKIYSQRPTISQWGIALSYISIKAIGFGEAVRLCRLNERKFDFLKSLVNLKNNCIRLNFNQKMTENMLEIAKQ